MTLKLSLQGPTTDPNMGRGYILDLHLFPDANEPEIKSLFVQTDRMKLALDEAVSQLKLMHDMSLVGTGAK